MSASRAILVLTNDAGLGHRRAAQATVSALTQRYGAHCRAVLVNPLEEPDAPLVLRELQSDFSRVVRLAPNLYRLGHGIANSWLPTRLMEQLEVRTMTAAIGRILDREQPDVVVTTHPAFVYLLVTYRRRTAQTWPIVVLVTDLARLQRLWFRPEVDLYLVPTTDTAALARRRGIDPRRSHVTGVPVDPRLSEARPARDELRAGYGWPPDLPVVLAVGSRRVVEFTSFLRALNDAGLPIHLEVVTGDDETLLAEARAIDWQMPVCLRGFVDDFPDRLRAADAVITKAGGLTVAEALAAGTPLFIIQATPMHERGNAEYATARGAAMRADNPAALVAALRRALADERRLLAKMAANAAAAGQPRAAYEAAEFIWALAERPVAPVVPQIAHEH